MGTVILDSASIGDLIFSGAYLDGNGGNALEADGVTVIGTMSCNEVPTTSKPGQEQRPEPGQEGRFRIRGEIWLRGANVGELNLRGAQLDGNDGYALRADQITVTRTIVGGISGNKSAMIRGSPRVSAVIVTQLVTQPLALGWLRLSGALDA